MKKIGYKSIPVSVCFSACRFVIHITGNTTKGEIRHDKRMEGKNHFR